MRKENGLSDVVLLNDKKKITETLNGTIFLLKSNQIQTPIYCLDVKI